ncbi:MAG: hypothetical protein RL417_970 [Pseudomonadota bacterium]
MGVLPLYSRDDVWWSMQTRSGAALKIVASAPSFKTELELWSGDGKDAHSLHYASLYPQSFRPELPAYFIERYTKRGDVVLDPFCGSGTTSLEAALQGRIAFASDSNPLALRMTAAKLSPADITEVTLGFQNINLRKPVDLTVYRQVFAPFYDHDTYRELVNLRTFLQTRRDRIYRFVELVALGLLHGHSAGYFSVYTFPQLALSPEEQEALNCKRRQNPDYRSIVPRILRKTASLLRDGVPSVLRSSAGSHRVELAEAVDLSTFPTASVDLVVTGPPLPRSDDGVKDLWLKLWFAGVATQGIGNRSSFPDLSSWLDYMNAVLCELARVVKGGGRAVLDLREIRLGGTTVALDEELQRIVEESLGRFWSVEGTIINKERPIKVGSVVKERDPGRIADRSRMLILRRR